MYHSVDEESKAANMRIRMKLNRDNFVSITRDELDIAVSHFRSIYKSFFGLKTYVDRHEIENFDSSYNINNFFMLNKTYPDTLIVKRNPFNLLWSDETGEHVDELCKQHLKSKIFDSGFVKIIRETYFEPSVTNETILYHLCTKHLSYIEFMLKVFRKSY